MEREVGKIYTHNALVGVLLRNRKRPAQACNSAEGAVDTCDVEDGSDIGHSAAEVAKLCRA